MNPFFAISYSKCCSFKVDDSDTNGYCVHVQIWKLVLEWWVTFG